MLHGTIEFQNYMKSVIAMRPNPAPLKELSNIIGHAQTSSPMQAASANYIQRHLAHCHHLLGQDEQATKIFLDIQEREVQGLEWE